jgi:hypothetical protein
MACIPRNRLHDVRKLTKPPIIPTCLVASFDFVLRGDVVMATLALALACGLCPLLMPAHSYHGTRVFQHLAFQLPTKGAIKKGTPTVTRDQEFRVPMRRGGKTKQWMKRYPMVPSLKCWYRSQERFVAVFSLVKVNY